MSCSISTMVRLALQPPQGLDDALRFLVPGAGKGLVEKEQLRLGRKRDGEFELALLAVGEQARRACARGAEADRVETIHRGLVQGLLPRGIAEEAEARSGARLNRQRHVLEGREARQDRGDLERAGEAAPTRCVHRQMRDVLAVEQDLSGIGGQHAGDLVDQRRLAGAVRADDGVQLAGLNGRGSHRR